jgi:hypothetical protein
MAKAKTHPPEKRRGIRCNHKKVGLAVYMTGIIEAQDTH